PRMSRLALAWALIGMMLLAACQSASAHGDTPKLTPTATITDRSGTPLPTIDLGPTLAGTPSALTLPGTLVLPTLTPYPNDRRFSLGQSVEGRDIWAWQFGNGPHTIVLIGGIHGGYEANTVVLSEELVNY